MLFPMRGQPGFIDKLFGKNTKIPDPSKIQEQYLTSRSFKVPRNSPYEMKKALALGPVSVLVNANRNFLFYLRGIIDSKKCGSKINHAVLAVGYGTDKKTGKDYFIIKNSWGRLWGEGGYAKIAADQNKFYKGMCGILQFGTFALIE